MVSNILIAVDGTPAATAALTWARELVAHEREAGHEVSAALINVIEPNVRTDVEGFGLLHDHEGQRQAAALLDDLVDAAPDTADFEKLVASGAVAQTILDEARARHADLIVVGTRHEGAIRQSMLGSVSQALAAERERPIAIVPAEYSHVSERAVVGYDGSPGSRAAIRWALENCDGDVRVVRVVPAEVDLVEAHESIAALLPALGHDAAGRVRGEALVGDPIEVLTGPDHHTPQIVVGARSERLDKDQLWGSTTTQLLADTVRPVVVVPPEPWD